MEYKPVKGLSNEFKKTSDFIWVISLNWHDLTIIKHDAAYLALNCYTSHSFDTIFFIMLNTN